MHPFPYKAVEAVAPAVIKDDAAFTATAIDTLGFDYCVIAIQIGATDIAMAALKVQESDDNAVADAYADVVGLRFGTDAGIDGVTSTLPAADADNTIRLFFIDCRKRERYLKVAATAGDGTAGTYLSGMAFLGRAKEVPVTAAGLNAGEVLQV